MGISADVFTSQRGDFRERLARLAGRSTYRVPSQGRSTAPLQLTDQDMAAALAYARRGPRDVGPDIAYCIACQSGAYRRGVTRELALALATLGMLSARNAQHLRTVAEHAFDAVVFIHRQPRPLGMTARSYDALLAFAEGTLWQAAGDAIHRAERAYRRESEAPAKKIA